MNLKLRRLVRTPTSEQYALFDLDRVLPGESDQASADPPSVGKLDLHFTDGGVYGTVLLWQSFASQLPSDQRRAFVEALLSDISQPMGLPDTFAVEFFSPDLGTYSLIHNLDEEGRED
jgi:hypothetical protein